MVRKILKFTRIFRGHSWEPDSVWIRTEAIKHLEKMKLPITRMVCSKCGEVTPPFNIQDLLAHKYFHNLKGCKGYMEDYKREKEVF